MARKLPILAEPDQRYWRRRANRRVRKARLTRTIKRWAGWILALAIIGAALFQAGTHLVDRWFRFNGALAVERIDVEGAHRAGPEAIAGRLSGFLGRSIIDLNLYEVAAVAQGDPWVLEASAKRILPGTLRVTVAERRPCAVAEIDGHAYVVDETGYIVGPGRLDGLPVLAGLSGLDREMLVARLRQGVRAVERLRDLADGWTGEVRALDLSRRDRIVVHTTDPGPVILLDPDRVERNVVHYLELRREIARQAGPLDYVDLRWRDRISVMPRASHSKEGA